MDHTAEIEDLRALRNTWRKHQRSIGAHDKADLSIGITATFTADPLTPLLGTQVLQTGYGRPRIVHANYNQVVQTCLDHRGAFGDDSLDVMIILWRIEDLADVTEAEKLREGCNLVLGAVERLRANFSGTIVLATPPRPRSLCGGLVGFSRPSELDLLWHETARDVAETTHRLPRVYGFDLETLIARLGEAAAVDGRKALLYRQPYSEAFYHSAARTLARIVRARKNEAKKCLVLDCDNTLWGGIVGEDGVGGVALGQDFPGNAFRTFQRQVKALKDSGIFIALNSKNNPDDVWEVFDKHEEMILRKEDIITAHINWRPKSENLAAIAAELNIGLDALIFIDDNEFEIAEVERNTPDVVCLKVPQDVANLPLILHDKSALFDRLEITKDDRKRVSMMHGEMKRRQLSQGMTSEEFLASLGLKVYVYPPSDDDLTRVAQLINKTNQFNVTTRRYTLDDILAFRQSGRYMIVCASVADQFGDYGLVGVAITEITGEDAHIDTLLMSCRVLGRGVESALIFAIANDAKVKGAKWLRGLYVPTRKNQLVADLFERHGFELQPQSQDSVCTGATAWVLDMSALRSLPSYLKLFRDRPS